MPCVRCLGMGFPPSKARSQGQFSFARLSAPRGPLHRVDAWWRSRPSDAAERSRTYAHASCVSERFALDWRRFGTFQRADFGRRRVCERLIAPAVVNNAGGLRADWRRHVGCALASALALGERAARPSTRQRKSHGATFETRRSWLHQDAIERRANS
jgi:hypothetical protein